MCVRFLTRRYWKVSSAAYNNNNNNNNNNDNNDKQTHAYCIYSKEYELEVLHVFLVSYRFFDEIQWLIWASDRRERRFAAL